MQEITANQRKSIYLLPLLATSVLGVVAAVYPPYSLAGVFLLLFGGAVLLFRPDMAFALYFGWQALFSEDILLMNETLAPTIYRINLPFIGLNVFEVAVVLLIAVTVFQRGGRFYRAGLDFSMAVFGFACLTGYLTCVVLYHDPGRLFEPRRLLHFFIAYFLTVNLIRDKKTLQMFITVFMIAVILKSLQGVYLFQGGAGLQVKWRIRAIFTGWEDSLNFMTYLIFLLVFVIDRVRLPLQRLFLVFTPTVLYCFLFAYKRAYYVAMLAGLGCLTLMLDRKTRVRFIALMMVGLVLLLGVITVAGQWQAISMRITSTFEPTKESSANYRLIEYQNAIISIKKNPVLGIGLGGVMPMVIHLSRTNLLGVHNTYLWVAVKMGIIGLFAYLFLNVVFTRHLIKQNRTLQDPYLRTISRAIFCTFIAFCAAQMFAPMFSEIRTSTWFGIMLGIGMMLGEMDKKLASTDDN